MYVQNVCMYVSLSKKKKFCIDLQGRLIYKTLSDKQSINNSQYAKSIRLERFVILLQMNKT